MCAILKEKTHLRRNKFGACGSTLAPKQRYVSLWQRKRRPRRQRSTASASKQTPLKSGVCFLCSKTHRQKSRFEVGYANYGVLERTDRRREPHVAQARRAD